MNYIYKTLLTASITVLSMTTVIACPVTHTYDGDIDRGIGAHHWEGDGVDAWYVNINNNERRLTVKLPGGGQWSLDCNAHPSDCSNALGDITDGHTPDRPPSADSPDEDTPPDEDEPAEGDGAAPSDPPPFSSEIPGRPTGPFDRSQVITSSDCGYFKETIKQVKWNLVKIQYYKKYK